MKYSQYFFQLEKRGMVCSSSCQLVSVLISFMLQCGVEALDGPSQYQL